MITTTQTFGKTGGHPFSSEIVKKVGLRTGKYVDAIILNDVRYGGLGGHPSLEIKFEEDEYIESVIVRHGKYIDGLTLKTNRGKIIKGGGNGGTETTLENIRVISIGGRSGKYLDSLKIEYINNYDPSIVKENSIAIIDIVAPGTSIETYAEFETKNIDKYNKVMEMVFTRSIGIEIALTEFIKKFTSNTSIKATNRKEITKEVTEIQKNSTKETFTTPSGKVGLEIVPIQVFREPKSNFHWMAPFKTSQLITVDEDIEAFSDNIYDLTGVVSIQIPSVSHINENRNGYIFYPKVSGDKLSSPKVAKINLNYANNISTNTNSNSNSKPKPNPNPKQISSSQSGSNPKTKPSDMIK